MSSTSAIEEFTQDKYKYGFVTDIEAEILPPGLNEEVIAFISQKKNEPQWLLDWRLKAYKRFLEMVEPEWAHVHYPKIDFQNIKFYLRL